MNFSFWLHLEVPTATIPTKSGNRCSDFGSLVAGSERFFANEYVPEQFREQGHPMITLVLLFAISSKMLVVFAKRSCL